MRLRSSQRCSPISHTRSVRARSSSSALSSLRRLTRSEGEASEPSRARQVRGSHTPLSGRPLHACGQGVGVGVGVGMGVRVGACIEIPRAVGEGASGLCAPARAVKPAEAECFREYALLRRLPRNVSSVAAFCTWKVFSAASVVSPNCHQRMSSSEA